jgi:hypothetical protein
MPLPTSLPQWPFPVWNPFSGIFQEPLPVVPPPPTSPLPPAINQPLPLTPVSPPGDIQAQLDYQLSLLMAQINPLGEEEADAGGVWHPWISATGGIVLQFLPLDVVVVDTNTGQIFVAGRSVARGNPTPIPVGRRVRPDPENISGLEEFGTPTAPRPRPPSSASEVDLHIDETISVTPGSSTSGSNIPLTHVPRPRTGDPRPGHQQAAPVGEAQYILEMTIEQQTQSYLTWYMNQPNFIGPQPPKPISPNTNWIPYNTTTNQPMGPQQLPLPQFQPPASTPTSVSPVSPPPPPPPSSGGGGSARGSTDSASGMATMSMLSAPPPTGSTSGFNMQRFVVGRDASGGSFSSGYYSMDRGNFGGGGGGGGGGGNPSMSGPP